MARIPLIEPDDSSADPAALAQLQKVTGIRGGATEPNVYKALANHPEAMGAVLEIGRVAYWKNSLTRAQSELAYLTASYTNDCHY